MSNLKKIYTFAVEDKTNAELPQKIKDAMNICGWNALGIYELVAKILSDERKKAKS